MAARRLSTAASSRQAEAGVRAVWAREPEMDPATTMPSGVCSLACPWPGKKGPLACLARTSSSHE